MSLRGEDAKAPAWPRPGSGACRRRAFWFGLAIGPAALQRSPAKARTHAFSRLGNDMISFLEVSPSGTRRPCGEA